MWNSNDQPPGARPGLRIARDAFEAAPPRVLQGGHWHARPIAGRKPDFRQALIAWGPAEG